MPSGMLTQHKPAVGDADRLRGHDFIRERILEDTVLVDASLVGKGVAADDGFIGLHGDIRDLGQQLAHREEPPGVDVGSVGILLGANAKSHYDLFEGSVSGAFPNSVDRALDLAGTGGNGRKAVGHGQAEIVVTMSRDDYVIDPPYPLANIAD